MLRARRHEYCNGSTEKPSARTSPCDSAETVIRNLRRLNGLSFASEKSAHVINELDRVRQTLVTVRQHIVENSGSPGSGKRQAIDVDLAAPFLISGNPQSDPTGVSGFAASVRTVPRARRESVRSALEKIDEIIRQIDFTRFELSRRTSLQNSPLNMMRKFIRKRIISSLLKQQWA